MRVLSLSLKASGNCLAGVADLLLPQVCSACGAAGVSADGLCEACSRSLLSLVALRSCPRCGSTVGPNIPLRADGCAGCPHTLPRFERVFRLGPYAGCLRRIVRDLKYRRRTVLRRRLGRLLAERVAAGLADGLPDVVLPVPMHWRRRLARGFDHARAIASRLAAELALPLGADLVRVRNTPPQTNLPRTARALNVRGAFAVPAGRELQGARVLLVDDVLTTGATTNEATRTLLAAGAHRVAVAVVAKSEPPTAYAAFTA